MWGLQYMLYLMLASTIIADEFQLKYESSEYIVQHYVANESLESFDLGPFSWKDYVDDQTLSSLSNCLVEPNQDGHVANNQTTRFFLICSSEFNKQDINREFELLHSGQVLDVNCGGNTQTGTLNINYCFCFDVEKYEDSRSPSKILPYNPGCVNQSIELTKNYFLGQSHLKVLVLTDLPIEAIAPNVFDDLSSVNVVSLSGNSLGNLDFPSGLFRNNQRLWVLHLQGPNIIEFPSHLLFCENPNTETNYLPELYKIIIENTAITTLPKDTLGCTQNVISLILPNNMLDDITNLCAEDTQSTLHLEVLVARHNVLSNLTYFGFSYCPELKYLDLGFNLFEEVNSDWFEGLEALETLLLNNNNIVALDGNFARLPLIEISLGYNKLKTLPDNVLRGLKTLKWLDLQANHLNDLQQGSLGDLKSLYFFNVSSNNLTSMATVASAFQNPAFRLSFLICEHNRISEIYEKAFINFPRLRILLLSNNTIKEIDERAFRRLPNLLLLSMKNNEIRNVQSYTNLNTLTFLFLHDNKISNLPDRSFLGLNRLKVLELSNNSISYISNITFDNIRVLEHIYLDHNRIESIDRNAFPPTVQVIKLRGNRLTGAPCIDGMNELAVLLLGFNNITYLNSQSFCNIGKLNSLVLNNNQMASIEQGAFHEAANLKYIDLGYNNLNIDFSNNYFEGTVLDRLYLNGNNITSIENLFFHSPLQTATRISLRVNPIEVIPRLRQNQRQFPRWPATETLDFTFCNISLIHEYAVYDLLMLKQVLFVGNQIKTFPSLKFLVPALALESLKITYYQNQIECNCKMRWLRKNETLFAIYNFQYCIQPVNNSRMVFTEVPLDQFVCKTQYACDQSLCTCFSENTEYQPTITNCSDRQSMKLPSVLAETSNVIFLNGNNYHRLALSSKYMDQLFKARKLTLYNSSISEIEKGAFNLFRYLEELYLHDNYITSLPDGIFSALFLLKILTLHNNFLVAVNDNFLWQNNRLEIIRLHHNLFEELSEQTKQTFTSLFYLRTLTLHENPWICKCDNMSLKSWLSDLNAQQKLGNIQDIKCENGTSILQTPDDVFLCHEYSIVTRNIGPFLATGIVVGILLIVIISMVVVFRHRHFMAVLMFNFLGIRMFRRPQTLEGVEYDAILLFDDQPANENYDQTASIIDEIHGWMTDLEPPYKVLMPVTDIEGGTNEIEMMYRGMQSSHKIVIFITEEFIQKPETMFLFDNAFTIMSSRRSLDVILIIDSRNTLNYIRSKRLCDQRLKAFMKSNNYLMYSDKHLHKKLMYLLPGNVRRTRRQPQNLNVHVNPAFEMD